MVEMLLKNSWARALLCPPTPDGDGASLMLSWFDICQHAFKGKLREDWGKLLWKGDETPQA